MGQSRCAEGARSALGGGTETISPAGNKAKCKKSSVASQSLLAAVGTDPGNWPFLILLISVVLLVVLITVVRLHAFLALIVAAIVTGFLTPAGSLPGEGSTNHFVWAVELTTQKLGETAGEIALVVGLAAIIGMCLAESGGADKVVRRFLAVFGEKRSGLAILVASYVLSMPIFFDTFFMLLLPIARALAIRTKRNYVLYLMAICSGGVMTHGLVIPHPGPLAMAGIMKVDAGQTIIAALLVGLIPLAASWFLIKWMDRKYAMPVPGSQTDTGAMDRPESELPPFILSILPVITPILLISAASTVKAMKSFAAEHTAFTQFVVFLGNRNIALIIGAGLAIALVMRQRKITFATVSELIGPPFETAGVIILITSAGGAFGLMLASAGVGEAIRSAAAGRDMNFIILAWVVASVIRVAQGSTTVALLTTAGMVQPMIASAGTLPYHPIYIFCAIGFGGMILSWMNDSGFWVIGRLSGFNDKQTLRTWTVLLTFNSIVGLLATLLLSKLLPLV
jgi:GntP family gluconate:H+ symporter